MKELYCTTGIRSFADRVLKSALTLVALLSFGVSTQAQISVTTAGSTTNNFGSIPPAAQWSHATIAGGAGDVESNAAMDTDINTTSAITAAGIAAQVQSDAGNPPGTSANGRWSSTGFYLATRPTGNRATLLMATLRNDSGDGVGSFNLQFEYQQRHTGANVNENVPGLRLYYSISGAAGSWVAVTNIGRRDPVSTPQPQNVLIDLTTTPWHNGTTAYLLFADDNANQNDDWANTIDNFAIANVQGTNVICADIVNDPVSISVPERGAATFSITATGTPQTIRWYRSDDGGNVYNEIAGANSSSYSIPSTVISDNGARFFATVSNVLCNNTSTVAVLTVQPDVTPPTVIAASGNVTNTVVNITFSEPMDVNTINEAAFVVFPTGGNPDTEGLVTFSFQLENGTNVTIGTDARAPGVNYSVRILDVRDASSGNNLIDPNPTDVQLKSRVLLIGFDENNIWKWTAETNLFGTGWETASYDDSDPVMWPEGPSGLGNDGDNAVALRTTTAYAINSAPQFFRRHFFVDSSTNGLELLMRHCFEDGAVVFINGQEAGRFNVGPGPLSVTTRALVGPPGVAPIAGPVSLPLTNVVPGDNVIAVVVIQTGATSSDAFMAIELVASITEFSAGPPDILNDPQSQTVPEGANVTFSVNAKGKVPLTYHWLKDGNPIPGANLNAASYSIFGANATHEGNYSVIVSNALGIDTSAAANLDVGVDNDPPLFVSAVASTNLTNITLTITDVGTGLNFETATNPANYAIALTAGGGDLVIESAVATSASNIVLTTSPRAPGVSYTIVGSEIVDRAVAQNPLTPSSILVTATESVMSFNHVWRYDQSGQDLGLVWTTPGYNDSAWPSGQGVLGFEDTAATLTFFTNIAGGSGTNTVLSPTNQTGAGINGTNVTFYFRTTVNLDFDPTAPGNAVRLRAYIDDGAAIYVNGAEAMRFNLTNTANYTNFSIGTSTEAAAGLVVSNVGGFVQGDNLIAVEVHQVNLTSSDMAWALEIDGLVTTFGPGRPRLHIARGPGAQLTITWSGGGVLQETGALSDDPTWTDVAGNPQGSYTFTPTGQIRFFSLRQ